MPNINVLGSTMKVSLDFILDKFVQPNGAPTTMEEGAFLNYYGGKIMTYGFKPSKESDVGMLQEDGTPHVGNTLILADIGHRHPKDSTKADKSNAVFTGYTKVTSLRRATSVSDFALGSSILAVAGTYYFVSVREAANVNFQLPLVNDSNVGCEIYVRALEYNGTWSGSITPILTDGNSWIGSTPSAITTVNTARRFYAVKAGSSYGWINL